MTDVSLSKPADARRRAGGMLGWVVLAGILVPGALMMSDPARAAPGPETLGSTRKVVLGDRPVEVRLDIQGGARRLASRPAGERLYLVLKDATAAQPPGTLYRVSLGSAGEVIGSVNFFNAEPNRPRTYSFDVTEALRNPSGSGSPADALKVTIAPGGQPNPGAKPTIGEIALVAQ
jgi:hypothetical protein